MIQIIMNNELFEEQIIPQEQGGGGAGQHTDPQQELQPPPQPPQPPNPHCLLALITTPVSFTLAGVIGNARALVST